MMAKRIVQWLTLLLAPIALVVLEWGHPASFHHAVYDRLAPMSVDWLSIHMFQSFLFLAISVGVFLLTESIPTLWQYLARVALFFFSVFYLVFDSTAGIAVGLLVHWTATEPSIDFETANFFIQSLFLHPIFGGMGSVYSLGGSYAWVLSIGCIVIGMVSKYFKERPFIDILLPAVFLSLSAVLLCITHAAFYGPAAFACFAVANAFLLYRRMI